MVLHLDHIGIMTPDCDASLAFYVENFGFEKGERVVIPRDGGFATLQFAHLGDLVLEFVQPQGGTGPMVQPPIHFSFRVKDIYDDIARLKAKGVKFDREDEIPLTGRTPKHRNAFCYGPAGERIELMMVED
jgi:catechol 2,3-dioxygenase-like lactoylglutathione lyase family enzyme